MFVRAFGIVLLATLVYACGNGKTKGRYISDSDTSFSKDIRDISARINHDPANAELYYLRGNTFFYQDKYKDALMDLETAVAIDSLNATYHYRLGETILKLDTADYKKAISNLQKAVQLQPKLYDAQLLLGKLFIARQQYSEAEKLFKSMTNVGDFADKAMLYLGISKKEQKDTNQALVYFDKSLQLNPSNYDAAMQVALLKMALNDPKAIDYFNRVLAINEYSDEAFYGKGLLLQREGKYKDALACYDKASTINPEHKLARYNAAVIYSIFEDWEKAEEWCNKTLDLDAKNANALALRGYTYEKRGNKKAALADYRAALDIDASNMPAKAGLKALGYN